MQRTIIIVLGTVFLFLCPAMIHAEDWSPIVSTDWLAENMDNSEVRVVDIREAARYNEGHIPGSLNASLQLWAVNRDGLTLELPSDKALQNLLGTFGIHPSDSVVVVTGTETDFSRADATRVAWTCKVAGIEKVAVLDGGYTKWVKDGKAVSTAPFTIRPFKYQGTIDRSSSISKNQVLSKIGESTIVDARTPEDYFGITSKEGHIKSAVNLPIPWVFTSEGTFREKQTLQAIAEGVIGADKSKEVIVYCGVGGYASTWWYLLTQMLGYRNVKVYDGSMEEWILDPHAPVQLYTWH